MEQCNTGEGRGLLSLQIEREIVDLLECAYFSGMKTWTSRHTKEDLVMRRNAGGNSRRE